MAILALAVNVGRHFWVPSVCFMTEMNTSFKQLLDVNFYRHCNSFVFIFGIIFEISKGILPKIVSLIYITVQFYHISLKKSRKLPREAYFKFKLSN